MSKRLVVAFLLVFAFAYFMVPGQAFAAAALTITKTDNGPFTVGTNGTYTLTVKNVGTTATSGAITVTDMLPAGLTFITGTGTNWSCSASGQMVTCTNTVDSIAVNGTSTITLTVSVGVGAAPSVSNTAFVSGGGSSCTSTSCPSPADTTTVKMTVKSGPAVYISTFVGQQILVVDGAVGTTAAIHTVPNSGITADTFSPEDIVVGPDKRIYICDPEHSKIYRVRQDDTGFETIYNQNGNLSLPAFPEGPSFNGSDLYFNTHFSQGDGSNGGVWKITGATASVPSGGFTPTQVFDRGTAGEGTAFGTAGTTNGKLLSVERSNNQVLSCDPSSCTSPTTLIPPSPCGGEEQPPCRLAMPIGIAVRKSDGHIFVANAGSLQNINHFDSSGAFVETYASFSGNDHPFFLEFDALGRLYVVTADLTGAGGKVWRIDPTGGETNLVFLVALSTSITGVASNNAVGVGVAPNAAITKTYSAGSPVSNTFDFATDQVKITFPGVSTAFDLTVFREEVPEALLGLQLATNFAGITCFEYNSDRGTCVGYEEGVGLKLDPLPPTNFTGPTDYQLFYTPPTGLAVGKPVLAHALDNNLQTPVDQFDEDELKGFTLATSVSTDPDGMDGSSNGCCSRHVALNTPLVQTGTTFCPLPPVAMDGLTFNKPQTIAIKFQIAASGGSCAAGPFVTSPAPNSQLWLFNPATSTFITPDSSGSSSLPNAFHFDPTSGVSIFNLNTKDLPAPATYIFTITSDSVSAHFSFFFLIP